MCFYFKILYPIYNCSTIVLSECSDGAHYTFYDDKFTILYIWLLIGYVYDGMPIVLINNVIWCPQLVRGWNALLCLCNRDWLIIISKDF